MDGLGAWPLSELVPFVAHARTWGKPVVFVGTGVEGLHHPESRQLITNFVADYVAHWSVRSPRDQERLLALGVAPERITVAADLAWLLPPATTGYGERKLQLHGLAGQRLVGVNINAEHALLAKEPNLFEKLAALLDRLVAEHDVRIVFLCNEIREGETYDKAAATQVRSLMRRQNEAFILPNEYMAPQQMMSIIASCKMTISTRYHFCLFSALQGVPFLAIKRSDKVVDLCEDLGWPFGTLPGSIDVEHLARQAATLLGNEGRELQELRDRVDAMRERALRNDIALNIMHERASTVSHAGSLRAVIDRYNNRAKKFGGLEAKRRA
jgi:polysaccharide pyruvyl transferase WcaK-like protein